MVASQARQLITVDVSDDLAAVLAQFPLPAGVPDEDMNQAEIAGAFNVSVNTVGKWVSRSVQCQDWQRSAPGFLPVIETGGPGRAYVLRMSHVWAWRQFEAHERAARDRHISDAQMRMQAAFLNMDLDGSEPVLSPDQRRKIAEADLMVSRAAKERRQLVRLVEVVEVLESVLSIVRNGVEGMPDRLERELSLRPEQLDLVRRVGDDILHGIAQQIEDAELRERDLSDVAFDEQLTF